MFDWRSLIENKKEFLLQYKRYENIPLHDFITDDIIISHSIPKSTIPDWSDESENENESEEVERRRQKKKEEDDKRLPFLHKDIEKMGKFIIKINETSPKDSLWISTEHSLKCDSLDDSLIMLKSSDRITFSSPSSLTIVKWDSSLKSCNEFRCFVACSPESTLLIAVSQKDDCVFYEHLLERKEEILKRILSCINGIFKNFKPNHYVLDIFLEENNRTVIIDIGEWRTNSAILWEWEELEELQRAGKHAQIRLIENEGDCRMGSARLNCYENFI